MTRDEHQEDPTSTTGVTGGDRREGSELNWSQNMGTLDSRQKKKIRLAIPTILTLGKHHDLTRQGTLVG